MGSSHSSGTDRIVGSQRDLRGLVPESIIQNHIVTIPTIVLIAGLVLYLYLERRKRVVGHPNRLSTMHPHSLNLDQEKVQIEPNVSVSRAVLHLGALE